MNLEIAQFVFVRSQCVKLFMKKMWLVFPATDVLTIFILRLGDHRQGTCLAVRFPAPYLHLAPDHHVVTADREQHQADTRQHSDPQQQSLHLCPLWFVSFLVLFVPIHYYMPSLQESIRLIRVQLKTERHIGAYESSRKFEKV